MRPSLAVASNGNLPSGGTLDAFLRHAAPGPVAAASAQLTGEMARS